MSPIGMIPDVRHDLFGGRGAVKVYNLDQSPLPPFTAALWCELDPAGEVGRHRQEHFPEVIIGIEGDGEATVNDQTFDLQPGSVVQLPLGSILALRNRSEDAPLKYLIIKARG